MFKKHRSLKNGRNTSSTPTQTPVCFCVSGTHSCGICNRCSVPLSTVMWKTSFRRCTDTFLSWISCRCVCISADAFLSPRSSRHRSRFWVLSCVCATPPRFVWVDNSQTFQEDTVPRLPRQFDTTEEVRVGKEQRFVTLSILIHTMLFFLKRNIKRENDTNCLDKTHFFFHLLSNFFRRAVFFYFRLSLFRL